MVRQYNPDTKYINPKAEYILTSGQYITNCTNIPYIDPLELLGCTFVQKHDNTKQHTKLKDLLQYEGKFMVEYANGCE